jgi:hypothetical protein
LIDPDLLTLTVHVMRPIAEGEEITIACKCSHTLVLSQL